MHRDVQKKPIIILGSLLSVLVIVTIIYGLSSAKENQLKLEQLINTPYEVLDIRRNKKEQTYAVDIQANLTYADNILLANKLLKELEQYHQTSIVALNMNVYNKKTSTSTKDSIDFTDSSYCYTIETNGTYVHQYEPMYTEELIEGLLFSTEWTIENSQINKNELTFTANLPTSITSGEVVSILNELANEMIRYNFKDNKKASAIIKSDINETETYYYFSQYPNYLIYKTKLIG